MKYALLEPGKYYHVYNRARNGEPLFGDEESFRFFMKLYQAHIVPVAETYAWCLMQDHLHLLVRMRDDAEGSLYRPFALLFNSYASGYNRHYHRQGRVFRFKLKRIEIRSERCFREMIRYVNQNPWRHGAIEHPAQYRFSSFRSTLTQGPSLVAREKLIGWFGSREELTEQLLTQVDEKTIRPLLLEE
jgi:REP element-mobilizing transposase RayT